MFSEAGSHRLPIVVGVTGHRDVRSQDEPVLAAALDAIFASLNTDYPATPLLLLTALAEGADQIAAEVARRRSIPYRVPIPLPLELYREDFPVGERLARFDELVRDADGLPYAMPYYGNNDATNVGDAARRAHQYALLAAHLAHTSHLLVAMWDGVASDTVGGTAQAVRFRVLGIPACYRASRSVIDAPERGPVHHIYTARRSNNAARASGSHRIRVAREPSETAGGLPASLADPFAHIAELDARTPDPLARLYRRIDTFNADCARVPGAIATSSDSATVALMRSAERVASYYQRQFVRALQQLFFSSALALLVFELYAHVFPLAHPLVAVYLAASCFAIWTYVRARRGRYQDRAQDYRALELGLDVQQAWNAAGLRQSVADYYIRRQRSELDWIRDAIRTAHNVDRSRLVDEACGVETVRAFVLRQYAYFAGSAHAAGAAKRERDKAALHDRLSRTFLRTSFAMSALLVVYGFFAWLAPQALHALPSEERWHGGLIFLIASTAIAAALFHDYPARRGHPQHARRYEVMGGICGRALQVLDAAEQREERSEVARACILELGHEALSENGDWLLLHRDLPIELLALG